jgi:hypothetical protein
VGDADGRLHSDVALEHHGVVDALAQTSALTCPGDPSGRQVREEVAGRWPGGGAGRETGGCRGGGAPSGPGDPRGAPPVFAPGGPRGEECVSGNISFTRC